jgi:hypothetical protein
MTSHIADLDAARHELLELRAHLHRVREAAPTPGIAHSLRLADTYLFLALGYCGHNDELFPEEGTVDVGAVPFPHLR